MNRFAKISPARLVAFEILRRVETEQAYAANLLASGHNQLSIVDRRLAQELVLGVLRWQGQLDFLIETYSGRKIAKFDLAVVLALRLGLYQLRFLSRIPESAAVNEAVELVKAAGIKSAAGLANAILRRAAREKSKELNHESASARLSHPAWLLEKWASQFGAEFAQALALANNQAPPLALRFNALKFVERETKAELAKRGFALAASAIGVNAYRVIKGSAGDLLDLVESGAVYLQDEASQLVASLVAPQLRDKVLDLCAAPGSKTTQLAALLQNTGLLVACDLHRHRLTALDQACHRLGVNNVVTVALNAEKALPFAASVKFDCVLVDAPCSGTGTLRHNPEIKWRLTSARIAELSQLQKCLLANAAKWVKVGGRLVYSTCSLEREENETVVKDFLAAQADFSLRAAASELATEAGFIRTFPHLQGADGFFAAVLERDR